MFTLNYWTSGLNRIAMDAMWSSSRGAVPWSGALPSQGASAPPATATGHLAATQRPHGPDICHLWAAARASAGGVRGRVTPGGGTAAEHLARAQRLPTPGEHATVGGADGSSDRAAGGMHKAADAGRGVPTPGTSPRSTPCSLAHATVDGSSGLCSGRAPPRDAGPGVPGWARRTVEERLRTSAALWEHRRRIRPDWPSEAERQADLNAHVVLSRLLGKAGGDSRNARAAEPSVLQEVDELRCWPCRCIKSLCEGCEAADGNTNLEVVQEHLFGRPDCGLPNEIRSRLPGPRSRPVNERDVLAGEAHPERTYLPGGSGHQHLLSRARIPIE